MACAAENVTSPSVKLRHDICKKLVFDKPGSCDLDVICPL